LIKEVFLKEAVIVSAVRTPIGRYLGSLKTIPAYDLAAMVLNEAVKQARIDPASVDDVIMGQSYQNGEYANIARMALLKAGWPDTVPGMTIDRRCCSGLEAVCQASMKIRAGYGDTIVAGGVESMSTAEFYMPGEVKWGIGGKKGMPKGHGDLSIWGIPLYDRIQRARVMSQPEERYGIIPSMMSWAETAAQEEGISREACDRWALESHRKACAAASSGKFSEEIVPVPVPAEKGKSVLISSDEGPRSDTSLEKLTGLRSVMGGVCTAGNSSSENDGAAAVAVMSAERAHKMDLAPLGRIRSFAVTGDDPRKTYRTVPNAVRQALDLAELRLDQMGLIEIQEAFASQVLADLKVMGIDENDYGKINVNGSGISLGHPIACTGTRVLVTLLHEMRRRKTRFGLACICGGGGLGIAAVVERI
jgi:acetyl-CoA C-acetyltransferase